MTLLTKTRWLLCYCRFLEAGLACTAGSLTEMMMKRSVFWFPGTAAADQPGSTCMNQCVASHEPQPSLMPVHVHGLHCRLCTFSDVVVISKHHLQNLLLTMQYFSRFPQQEIFTCKSFRLSIDHYSAKWHILLRLMAFTFPVQEGWVGVGRDTSL